MGDVKKEISCLLMACVSSVAMGSGRALLERKNGVPVAQKVPVARKVPARVRSVYSPPEKGEDAEADTGEDAEGISRRALIEFWGRYERMLSKDIRSDRVIAEIRENREVFMPCLGGLVDKSSSLRPLDQSALLTVIIVLGERELMGRITIEAVAFHNDAIFGWTPVHFAMFLNDFDAIRFCIVRGTHADIRDGRGCTLLMMAIERGNIPAVRFLLGRENIGLLFRDFRGMSTLGYAKKNGNPAIVLPTKAAVDAAKKKNLKDADYDTGDSEDLRSSDIEYDTEEEDAEEGGEKLDVVKRKNSKDSDYDTEYSEDPRSSDIEYDTEEEDAEEGSEKADAAKRKNLKADAEYDRKEDSKEINAAKRKDLENEKNSADTNSDSEYGGDLEFSSTDSDE
ncbi:MAG: ankyrin repeat domain-containing protein [Puniceicoccales bacterium]|jgi:hypothetical protein|nr:ankyrin repeat domain-containing protein [Puniceicoccales bacterium]